MSNSNPLRSELAEVIKRVSDAAKEYIAGVDERPVISQRADAATATFLRALPETGDGAIAALSELIAEAPDAAAATSGPRYFHFVTGGATPAALGADWLASALDQIAYTWVSSPLGVQLELLALDWLKDLFDLPRAHTGIMTTGATMANYVGMAAARQWWGEQHDVDVSEEGMHGMPRVPVFSSGYVHASSLKVASMLGIGRSAIRTFARDPAGRLDAAALESALLGLRGKPAIIIANAGEVNMGDFDPIEAMADLAEKHNAWLHVDGAFGLFARVTPRAAQLCAGAERADSVTVDGHKWLNVPYDCGFSFVRDAQLLARAFTYRADYLPKSDDPRPTIGAIGPESSRRARALSVWATLRAYGRRGVREMVETHLDLAQQLADRVDAAPELERLAEVPLNIVCFRFNPGGKTADELDELNRKLGEAIIADGRALAGTTLFEGRVALRPAIVNWRTRPADIDFFVDVVRELANA
ncbi:MAG: aminotransferase class V-fold PLP-dependent enzyme [Gammaproteobacteria bacterium]|nr:aminotransferase class V-fold PLP-dependent enzyme [Gammaproteobacteria bacterium]NNF62107.1 aminotransferase class V-fold PLP-dependent enzyme [Gammaproteobacteria bacterium]NNM20491.1 aminotransferase class V-fold PLP-dependent enzyme [Gammaproteobacteria bacterium]